MSGPKQYREGDVDASIVGVAMMQEDAANVLSPVSATKPLPTKMADGGDATLGTTTDAAAGATTVEDTTARTGIGLFKGIKNLLKLINDKLVSGTDIGDVTINNAAGAGVYVQPGTSAEFAVSAASGKIVDGADVTQGATTDAAVTTDVNGTTSAKLRGLIVLMVNFLSRLPAALGAGGGLKVDGSGTALPVSGAVTVSGTATVTQGAAGASAWPVADAGVARAAAATYAAAVSVTNAATSIKAAVAARIRLELHHQGPDSAARVWLGADNTLTAGAAGKNFGYLDPGDTWESRDYTGAVYGRTEAGTALISYLEV